ncbi:MAG: hypothetical protein WD823_05320 [Sulfuricaulis sp.]|uniref:hypothetical protein n=1 Tax=Sulfuricaulis sp. TaxID=2003553 RepID=UPI0034A1A372
MIGTYIPWLVGLSVITAIFASFTVFHLVGRSKTPQRLTQKSLLFMSALLAVASRISRIGRTSSA